MKHDVGPRAQVQILRDQGYSQSLIANVIRRDKSFVERCCGRADIIDRPNHGRPPKITRSVLSQIEKRIMFKRRRSLRVVAQQMNLSKSSIQRATKKLGLVAYHQSWAPRLTLKHLADRKRFARDHKNFDWSKVLFIDEKIAFLIPKPNSKNDVIWAPKGSTIPNLPRDVHPVKWNVSAGISISGRSRIYIFDQNMNGQLFKEILASTLLPAGKKLHGNDWYLYMDRDPKHTSKLVTAYLQENHIRCLPTPANSPDLNAVENVWSMLDNELKKMKFTGKAGLKKAIKKAWHGIKQEKIRNCVLSMPHRMKLVTEANGKHVKY